MEFDYAFDIEITAEQFNQIQDEIIRLEEHVPFVRESWDTWEFISITERIETLKKILETERIEI